MTPDNFDMACADLTLQGWRPVCALSGNKGIHNKEEGHGFLVSYLPSGDATFTPTSFLFGRYGDITWDELGERILELLMEHMAIPEGINRSRAVEWPHDS